MTSQVEEGKQVPSFLEMSDEELMKLDPSVLDQHEEVTQPEPVEAPEGEALEGAETGEAVEEEQEEQQEEAEAEEATEEPEETSDEVAEAPGSTEPEQAAPTQAEIDYKAQYDRLMKPFKANGREIQVESVDDAISLMQMGANYNKKMAALKPNLKLLKMLENNELLSEEKLNFLIDLTKKDAGAITKLLKDSGIDPLELDTEKAEGYTPKSHKVDDREIELDEALDQIKHTTSYSRTLEVVSRQWDSSSRQVVANSPQLLKIINDHVERGIYDVIAQEVERERIFGRLNGLSDIEAYRQVGDAIQARGGFDHLAQKRAEQGQQTPSKPVVVPPKPQMGSDDKLREKRMAASTSRPAASSTKPVSDFNPLAMSDEEFSKLVKSQFL